MNLIVCKMRFKEVKRYGILSLAFLASIGVWYSGCYLSGRYGCPKKPEFAGNGLSTRSCEVRREEHLTSRESERSILYWLLEEPFESINAGAVREAEGSLLDWLLKEPLKFGKS